jgi:Uma2 family endonuclease
MGSTTLVSVGEYLSTAYRPDREYLDGRILERNLGERDHSVVQTELAIYLGGLRKQLRVQVFVEQRVQVTPSRFRIPDICVVAGAMPTEPVFTHPPFICIEILSKDDRMQEMQERIDDYLAFGVPYVWVINPRSRKAHAYTASGSREATGGFLRTENPAIEVPLADIFAAL